MTPNRLLARWCLVLALSHGYLLGHDTIPCRTRRHGSVSLVVRTSTKSWVASPANPVRNLPLDAAGGFFGVLADIGAANATLRLLPWAKLACTLTYLPALRDVYALFPWSLGSVAAVVRTMAATAALNIFLRAWEFHPFMVTRFVARRGGVAAEGERGARARAPIRCGRDVAPSSAVLPPGLRGGPRDGPRDVTPRMWRRLAALLSSRPSPTRAPQVLDPRAVAATPNRGGDSFVGHRPRAARIPAARGRRRSRSALSAPPHPRLGRRVRARGLRLDARGDHGVGAAAKPAPPARQGYPGCALHISVMSQSYAWDIAGLSDLPPDLALGVALRA